MTDIFISYAREDRPRVQKIASALEAEGFSLWWDDHIAGGVEFSRETETRLNQAKAVLVAWSKSSIESIWVADEATVGRDRGALVPIALDDAAPKIGFRQFQTIAFESWNGDRKGKEFQALCAALRSLIDGRAQPATHAPATPAAARPRQPIGRSALVLGSLAAVAAVAIIAIAFFALRPKTADGARSATLERAQEIDDATKRALAEIGDSPRAEEKAAYQSFVAGDEKSALAILEKLAADLEASGDRNASAATYTRAAAVALLVDQGRGLAARRKAFALRPQSMSAFQGLFFDTFLLQGYDAAMRLADESEARPDTSDDMRGFIYANRAVIESDGAARYDEARRQIERIAALRAKSDTPTLKASEDWAFAVIAYDNDETGEVLRRSEAGEALEATLPDDFPKNFIVNITRGLFAQGDWEQVFSRGSEALDARRRAGAFVPAPLLHSVCRAGLFLGRGRAAAPYCDPLTTQKSTAGDYLNKIYSALIAATAGDAVEAKAELDAAHAFASATSDPGRLDDLDFADAYVAGAAGDLDAAAAAVAEYAKHIAADPLTKHSSRSREATALRLFGGFAIKTGKPFRACEPLARASVLYAEIGGDVGAAKSDEMRRAAGCVD